MNILYIEDEPNDVTLVKLFVQSTEHNLLVATTADQARCAFSNNPDLILIDVLLGHTRAGLSLAREIRQTDSRTPLIAVTSLSTSEDLAECQRAGFTNILQKPFTINQLEDVIVRYTPT